MPVVARTVVKPARREPDGGLWANGPRRRLPHEQVEAIVRRVRAGEKPESVAREFGVSLRTVWRYLADPVGLVLRRFRTAIESWPEADALSPEQRESLARHLDEAYAGWLRSDG